MNVLKAIVIWIVAIAALVIATDKIIMPLFAGKYAETRAVPQLVGMPAEAAEAEIIKAGFKCEFLKEGRYNSQIPAGMILVQAPAAGHVAKLGRTIRLTKSLGLREVEIPDLRGKSQKQAFISLSRAGLVQGKIVKGAHKSIPRDVVVRTDPVAGVIARMGDTVDIVISAGNTMGKTLLPNFVGQQLDNVLGEVENLGFKVGSVKRISSEKGEAPGTVLETQPREGDYLPPDTKVDIVVAN